MEYLEGDLPNFAGQPNDSLFFRHQKALLSGLNQLHLNGVCHRDLKPNNVRLNLNGELRIFDFGISKFMSFDNTCDGGSSTVELKNRLQLTKNCVSRCYRPPEIFFGDRQYSYSVDIWSAACTLYEMATGEILFAGACDLEVLSAMF